MKSVYRILMRACYVLGFISVIMGILLRHVRSIYDISGYGPHGVFTFAGVLFLGSLASFAMLRLEPK
jgi:hypothetical protein